MDKARISDDILVLTKQLHVALLGAFHSSAIRLIPVEKQPERETELVLWRVIMWMNCTEDGDFATVVLIRVCNIR